VLSQKYATTDLLDFDDTILDGFYDPGRARVSMSGWRSLQV
jgi:hypothetical protein